MFYIYVSPYQMTTYLVLSIISAGLVSPLLLSFTAVAVSQAQDVKREVSWGYSYYSYFTYDSVRYMTHITYMTYMTYI